MLHPMSAAGLTPGWSWTGPTSPFLDPDSPFPADRLTDAVVEALRAGGVERVTLGAAAREMGVSSQATHKLAGGRAEFLGQVVATFLSRRWAWMTTGDGPARIPTSEEELHGLRVYRLLVELAAGEHRAGREGLAQQLERDRHRYRDWVRYSANQRRSAPMTEDDLDRFETIVDGLLTAMVRPLDALSPDLAQAILDEYLATTGWRTAG